ncbi:MAG: hypothetical protein V9G23_10760 [Giesbergeria sp.]
MTRLIPLYAIGVFLSFTLSQAGMARRWWKIGHLEEGVEIVEPGSVLKYEKGWQYQNGRSTGLAPSVQRWSWSYLQ